VFPCRSPDAVNNVTTWLPTQADAFSVAAVAPSLDGLLLAQYDGNGGTASRITLRVKLQDLQSNLSQVPSLSATSALLANISDDVSVLRSSRIIDTIRALCSPLSESTISQLPGIIGQTNASVGALVDNLDSIPFSAIAASIRDFNAFSSDRTEPCHRWTLCLMTFLQLVVL